MASPRPHALESPYVRAQISRRGTRLNDRPARPGGEYVLYWMQATHRFDENWALRFATIQADKLGLPLVVHQGLDPTYPHANDRIHSFILHNAAELAERATSMGLSYRFVLRHDRRENARIVDGLASRAAMVVTDLYPTAGIAERNARVAARLDVRMVAVESHAIIPSGIFEKEEYAARTIRPRLLPWLSHALQLVEDRPARLPAPSHLLDSLPGAAVDFSSFDVANEVARCDIDHAVPPIAMVSGQQAARARLRAFCRDTLPHYAERRVDPTDDLGSSRLSPYLHFGQIAAAEVARAALASGPAAQAEAFLGELVVWRELALNFCLRNPHHGSLEALPPWVHKTMAGHAADPREATYSLAQFEAAATHDPLWNAAQHELRQTGVMHNVVRMLWGKHFLAWAPTYAQGLAWAIHLNNKWGIDGRDPSSYAGVQWCFGKFDRPFYKRPVFGLIRPMSLTRARTKWDVDRYIARWSPPAR
jgi:deoxyribodipyrimidine photo-lyase